MGLGELKLADEVVAYIRGSKTDTSTLAPSGTTSALKTHASARLERRTDTLSSIQSATNGGPKAEPRRRFHECLHITREAVQTIMRNTALQVSQQRHLGAPSLRFGGDSALWAAFPNAARLKPYGWQAADCFHEYASVLGRSKK